MENITEARSMADLNKVFADIEKAIEETRKASAEARRADAEARRADAEASKIHTEVKWYPFGSAAIGAIIAAAIMALGKLL